jgi:KaiC/GvpD/RAD55 family RecA-like ATPase
MEYIIPPFLKIFIFIMFLQISITFELMLEARRLTRSRIWNGVFAGDFFCVLITLTHALLLCKIYNIAISSYNILLIFTVFYALTHFLVNIALYGIITPITGRMMKIYKLKYILIHISFLLLAGLVSNNIFYLLQFSKVSDLVFLYVYIFLSLVIFGYFIYYIFKISFSYRNIGFIYKPYTVAGFGGIALIISVSFILFCFHTYIEKELQSDFFYYIFFYLMSYLFSVAFYMRFVIGYPSLLQPKWKALVPFDLPKATATITLAFLAASLYLTANEYPNSIIYQNISYISIVAILLPFFLAAILIFTYLKTISTRIKLRYWVYLKYGVYIHLTVTFYVFGLIFLSWNNATSITKMLCAMFGLATFAVYLFFALDLRKIIEDLNIKPTFDGLDILRYTVSLSSWFFLLFFGISFTYGKTFAVFGFELVSYPIILFLIVFSLIALGIYLRVTHIAFEKIRGNSIWGTLTYIATFISFLLLYLIYSSLSTYMQRFPFRDLSFIGYFIVMLCWIATILTLRREPNYKEIEEEEITSLLNSRAHNFFRTDYLEGLWKTAVARYVGEERIIISFDPSGRRFNLENADEPTRHKIAVWILLEMHKLPDREKVGSETIEETKEEIAVILKDKVLMLPEDLRSQFDVDMYYPLLYEKVVNKLIRHLEAFIPFSEQNEIFNRVKRRDERYGCIRFEGEEIRMKEGTRLSRDEFFKLFKYYLESLEDKFPFKPFLLYELVREEIKKDLGPYDITVGNLLDIVPTGLEEMDKVMGGGLAKGSSTLLIAEETRTKHKILLSFIKQGLRARNSVIYATAKRPARQIQGELLIDFDQLKNFMLLDLYENIYTEERVYKMVEEEHRIIVPLNKIMFQRSIVKTIKSYPKDLPKMVVIDVYDNFSRYYSPEEVQKILQDQIDGLKRWNCTSLIAINPHSYLMRKEDVEVVKKNFDNVMILSGEDKAASVFIEKLYHGTPSKPIIRLQ